MKKLIIITGITGAVGNALLARYAQDDDTVIYGISRKAHPMADFINPETGKIYTQTLIGSIEGLSDESIGKFIHTIDTKAFASITYFHCLGLYPFEVKTNGDYIVENDLDNDGINDTTYHLSYTVYRSFVDQLIQHTKNSIKFRSMIFGSLSDKHEPKAHQSWWKTMKITKDYMKTLAAENVGMHVMNISSITCSHEIITRPFVFIKTNADLRYWLTPCDLANQVHNILTDTESYNGFQEHESYRKFPNFDMATYYQNKYFTPRKVSELY